MQKYLISQISYDTGGEEVAGLPESFIFELDEDEVERYEHEDEEYTIPMGDYFCELVTEATGWCVFGLSFAEVE